MDEVDDGRTFQIVKNFWPSDQLEERSGRAGFDIVVRETPTYFQYGVGIRR